jgi:hypothetical protein
MLVVQILTIVLYAKLLIEKNISPWLLAAIYAALTLAVGIGGRGPGAMVFVQTAVAFVFMLVWVWLINRLRDWNLLWWVIYIVGILAAMAITAI